MSCPRWISLAHAQRIQQVVETDFAHGKISRGKSFNAVLSTSYPRRYLDPDPLLIAPSAVEDDEKHLNKRFHSLNRAIAQLVCQVIHEISSLTVSKIEEHPLVSFLPLDLTITESIERIISHIDYSMQYGEDEEPKEVSTHRGASELWLMM